MRQLSQKHIDRVVDQTISAYAILHDRYRRRESVLTLAVTILSAFVLATVLAPSDFALPNIIDDPESVRLVVALLSFAAFVLALVQLVGRNGPRSMVYGRARDDFARFKLEYSGNQTSDEQLISAYQELQRCAPEIPSNQFARLKANHWRTVQVSKLISERPGIPHWAARLTVMSRAMFASGDADGK